MRESVILTTCLLCAHAADGSPPPTIKADPQLDSNNTAHSENGYYQISWSLKDADAQVVYVLQESLSPDFADASEVYEGPDDSTTFSGRQDGVFHYRVKAGSGPWSDAIKVVVQHHSLGEALMYLAAGAVVFLATGALVMTGHIRHRREGLHH